MAIDRIETLLRSRLPAFRGLGARVKFDFGAVGALLLDAVRTPPDLAHGDGPADCTIRMAPEHFERLLTGDLSPTLAYATGKLKVEGPMGLALKLASLLED